VRDVQIKKEELLERLRLNRDAHRAVFEKAMDVYKVRMTELLESLIKRAKKKQVIPVAALYDLPMPEDHTNDYDVAIEMLEHEEREVLTLTQQEFKRYFRDEWEWEQSFLANTTSYIAGR
jgi:hypothetical protein